MFDNLHLRIEKFSNNEFEKFCDLVNIKMPIYSEKMKIDFENLRIEYYPNTNILRIKNSLHKFYNIVMNDKLRIPINSNEFKFQDFYTVVDCFSEIYFNRPKEDFNVSSYFEYGFNIDTESYLPFEIIKRYQSTISTRINEWFTVSPRSGKPKQRECALSDYKIKGYDKIEFENQREIFYAKNNFENLLRLEVVITQKRKLNKLLNTDDCSLKDLISIDNWDILFIDFLKLYDNTAKIPFVSLETKFDELMALYSYSNQSIVDDLKIIFNDKNSFIKNRNFNRKIYEKYDALESNIHKDIRKKIICTYINLI